jgi:pyruvate/2-oxoglutarate dehydrogenase complex dihydrolipoamide acyltransferase (E2) component
MKDIILVAHRISDSSEATRFMQEPAEFLENPVRMLV